MNPFKILEHVFSRGTSVQNRTRKRAKRMQPFRIQRRLFGLEELESRIVPSTAANLDQCRNGPFDAPVACVGNNPNWVNGNAGAQQAHYVEGDSIPYRMRMTGLNTNLGISQTLVIQWDTIAQGEHAIDYITSWDRTLVPTPPENEPPGSNFYSDVYPDGVCPGGVRIFDISAYSQDTETGLAMAGPRNLQICGGVITSVSFSHNSSDPKQPETATITFTATIDTAVIAWGGHISKRQDYQAIGDNTGTAATINGSPYHTRLIELDGEGGNQDRSLSAAAVISPSTITIVKQASPEGSTPFQFTITPNPTTLSGSLNFSLVDDGTSANTEFFGGITGNFDKVAVDTFTVTEQSQNGWQLANLSCQVNPFGLQPQATTSTNRATATATINLTEGNDVTCTFTNQAVGTVIIKKDAVGGDGTFNFTATGDGMAPLFNITTSGGVGSQTFTNLSAGVKTVTEAGVPAGWNFTSLVCVDPANGTTVSGQTATINVAAGDTVVCTFTNTKQATVQIVKDTVGSDGTFTFAAGGQLVGQGNPPVPSTVSITTSGGAGSSSTFDFSNLPAAGESLSFAENAQAGWTFNSVIVSGDSGSSTSGPTASLDVSPGENIIVTYTNTRGTNLIVRKVMIGGTGTFTFTGTPSGSISTNDGIISARVSPGTYTTTEAATPGWDLTSISCDNGNSSGDVSTRTATFVATAAVTITCTFTNTKEATVQVVKDTVGGDGTFSFSAGGQLVGNGSPTVPSAFSISTAGGAGSSSVFNFSNLPAGGESLSVAENAQAGWTFNSVTVSGDASGSSTSSATATLNVSPGENIVVTYGNTKQATLIVKKVMVGGTDTFSFFGTPSGSISTNGGTITASVAPGIYTTSEGITDGWDLTSVSCDNILSTGNVVLRTATFVASAGQTVTCTFTNTKETTVQIVKDTIGGDGAFTFVAAGQLVGLGIPPVLSTVGIATIGGFGSTTYTFANLPITGQSLSFAENAAAGWDFTSVTVVGDPGSSTSGATALLNVSAGENIVVTFTNTEETTLVVKKVMVGGTDTFNFSGTPSGSISTNGGTISANVTPGTYTTTEQAKAGWDLTSISCDNGSSSGNVATGTATFVASAGQTVTCTYTNTKEATVQVVKDTLGGDGTFSFTTGGQLVGQGSPAVPSALSISTAGDVGSSGAFTFSNLPAAGESLSFAENMAAGWTFTGVTVSGDPGSATNGATATLNVSPGENIVVTYTNAKNATLIVKKVMVGGTGTFSFTGTPSGSISTNNGTISAGVAPGTYSSTEGLTPGWDLTSISCDDSNSSGSVLLRTATFVASAGETITCTFTNTKEATVQIVKDTIGGDGAFSFTATGQLVGQGILPVPSTVSIATAGGVGSSTFVFANLPALGQSLSFAENATAGWDFSGVTVVGDPGSSTSGATAMLSISAGENIVVTFTNTKETTLVVRKVMVGGTDTFDFSGTPSGSISTNGGTISANLSPGTYTTTEQAKAGWDLTSISCDNGASSGNVATGTATFVASAGQTVTCTFTNTKEATVQVVKDTLGGDGIFSFTTGGQLVGQGSPAVPSALGISTAGGVGSSGAFTFSNLPAAGESLSFAESATAGWTFTGVAVSGDPGSLTSGPTATLNVSPGENIVVTYSNAKNATLILKKVMVGGTDTFSFTGAPSGSISTNNGTISAGVAPGTYSSTEGLTAGWDLTSISCDDSNSSGSVVLRTATFVAAPGETVTCTFTNTKEATVQIVKDAIGGDGTFSFIAAGQLVGQGIPPVLSTVSIATAGGVGSSTFVFANLPAFGQTLSFAENATAGWDFTSVAVVGDPGCSTSGTTANLTVSAGENIVITFTNTKQATVTVVKDALGGDGTFSFAATGQLVGQGSPAVPSAVNITTAGGIGASSTFTFSNLAAAGQSLSFAESAVAAGWDFTSVTVSGDPGSSTSGATANLNVSPGENIVVTYTNTKRATVQVVKDTLGGDSTFTFAGGGQLVGQGSPAVPSALGISTAGGAGSSSAFTFSNLPAAGESLSFAENATAGWSFTGVTVSGDPGSSTSGATANLTVSPGESIVVTYSNAKNATLIVKKVMVGGTDTFSFTGSPSGSISTNNGTISAGVAPSTYTTTEALTAGWDLTSISCDDSNSSGSVLLRTATFVAAPGETVTCTFTNTKETTVQIVKDAIGGDGAFSFNATGQLVGQGILPVPSTVSIATVGGVGSSTFVFANLPALGQSLSLAENAAAGWDFTSVAVVGDPGCSTSGTTANLTVSAGENIVITFTNTKQATVTVVKDALGGDGTFSFAATGQLVGQGSPAVPSAVNITTAGGIGASSTFTFSNLAAAGQSLSFAESAVAAGWDFTSVTVSGDSGSSTSGATANLNVSPGENIVVAYTNTKRATLIVKKVMVGGTGTFTFSGTPSGSISTNNGTISASVAPGTYSSTEALALGWTLTSISCDDSNSSGNVLLGTATFVAAPGETVTCTFTNTKLATVELIKDTLLGDGTFVFTATGQLVGQGSPAVPATVSITTVGNIGSTTFIFANLPASGETLSFAETATAGWSLTSVTSVGALLSSILGNVASLTVGPGEACVVTYLNTKLLLLRAAPPTNGPQDVGSTDIHSTAVNQFPLDEDPTLTTSQVQQLMDQITLPEPAVGVVQANSVKTDEGGRPSLTPLQPIVQQAEAGWKAAGLNTTALDHLVVRVGDLPGDVLGLANESTDTIWIDRDAAGYGWTTSFTPGRMDLTTAITHEMGHILGLEHTETGVMAPTLAPIAEPSPGARSDRGAFIPSDPVVSTFVSAGAGTARLAPLASGPALEQRPPENPYSYSNGVLLGALARDVQPPAAYGLRPWLLPESGMEANPPPAGPEFPVPDDTPRSGAPDDQSMLTALIHRRFSDVAAPPARREHLIDRLFRSNQPDEEGAGLSAATLAILGPRIPPQGGEMDFVL